MTARVVWHAGRVELRPCVSDPEEHADLENNLTEDSRTNVADGRVRLRLRWPR